MSFYGIEPLYHKTVAVSVRQYCLVFFNLINRLSRGSASTTNKLHICIVLHFIFPGNKKNYIQMHDKLYYFVTSL